MIYTDKFAYKTRIKNLESVEQYDEHKQMENALVGFIQVEQKDEDNISKIETKMIKNLKWAAKKNETNNIVLHSFAHLSLSKADEEITKQIFDGYCGLILTDTLLRAIKKKARCPMSEKKRPNYTKEFKQDAIKLVIEQRYSCPEVGRRLGVATSNISRWVREYRQDRQDLSNNGITCKDWEAEIRRLKKENKRLEMEREILKKAAAFFAKESS